MTVNIFDFADTWNALGATFSSIKLNVSNGAGGAPVGAAASRVLDFLKNGTRTFGVDIDGVIYTPKSGNGNILVVDPVASDAGAKPLYLNYFKGGVPSGGTKANAKFNLGYNISASSSPADPTDVTQFMEFNTVTGFSSGTHIGNFIIAADSADGKRHTMYSMEIPFDSTQRTLYQGRMEFYTLALQDVDGTQYANFVWNPSVPKITLFKPGANPTQIQFSYNGSPAMLQLNAAGDATLSLPYVNSNDNLQVAQAIQCAIGKVNANNAFMSLVGSVNIPTGGRGVYVSATAAAGADVELFGGGCNSTGAVSVNLRNLGGGSALFDCWVSPAGGDAWTRYNVNGGGIFGVGLDNSDADAFVISANNGLGTNNRLRIDANTVALPTLPLKMASASVASLPAAGTVGANTRMFVTDASTPVFQATVVGGGAVLTPVYSDGTNWRVG